VSAPRLTYASAEQELKQFKLFLICRSKEAFQFFQAVRLNGLLRELHAICLEHRPCKVEVFEGRLEKSEAVANGARRQAGASEQIRVLEYISTGHCLDGPSLTNFGKPIESNVAGKMGLLRLATFYLGQVLIECLGEVPP